jgi:putative transposase
LGHGWVDGGYRGPFLDWAHQRRGLSFQVVSRSDGGRRRRWLPPGATPPIVSPLAVVPRRWVVERTFAWLGRYRRLSKDYEFLTATSEAVIYLAMTRLLLRRLTRQWALFRHPLVLQSQFGTLPLVMAATSGGLMTASPH